MKNPLLICLLFCLLPLQLFAIDQSTIAKEFSKAMLEQDSSAIISLLSEDYMMGNIYNKNLSRQVIPQIFNQYPKFIKIEFDAKLSTANTWHFNGELADDGHKTIVLNLDSDLTVLSIDLFDEIISQAGTSQENPESKRVQKKAPVTTLTYFNLKQRQELFNHLISVIEEYDAEGIDTRNRTKKINWNSYKKHYKNTFINSQNWQELEKVFYRFADGFVNLHSHFEFNNKPSKNAVESDVGIIYSYPEIAFYLKDTDQQVSYLNHTSINKAFEIFEAYDCRFNSTIGCLASFITKIEYGEVVINQNRPYALKLKNGDTQQINYASSSADNEGNGNKMFDPIVAEDIPNWKLIKKGFKVAVYQQNQNILLRIKNFVYTNGVGGNIQCDHEAKAETMCHDIRLVRKVLKTLQHQHQHQNQNLIIDVQDNVGGIENSPFIAEFATQPFKDLAVRFRKTKALEDDEIRLGLFYNSDRSENWYQQIRKNGTYDKFSYGDFLPKRADFCQGSEYCELLEIPANNHHSFKNMVLLSNQYCASSCDDLIWRLTKYADAKVVGLPSAADATYSRISVIFYVNEANTISHKIVSESQAGSIDGTEIFKITIPYSKLIDEETGEIIEGRPVIPNKIVSVNHSNFANHNLHVIAQAVEFLKFR